MKNKKAVYIGVAIALVIGFTAFHMKPTSAGEDKPTVAELPRLLNDRQMVWLYALEWCESSGRHDAINKKDVDGTPSYGAFQFKPSTFWLYGEKYGIVKRNIDDANWPWVVLVDGSVGSYYDALMHRDTQAEIVKHMIIDLGANIIGQFPDCVKKLGFPPK